MKAFYGILNQVWQKLSSGWKPYIERPIPLEDLDETMMSASIPSFGYFFMLLLSTVIATFGLLSNSAPAIIGAMIIAPLMGPIVSLAYGMDIFDWKLVFRSLLTFILGVLLVVVFAYLSTRVIGLRIAGSEIISRTAPTLMDLGIAMAAGAAAAFSYTRKSILSSIAGVAIAVALVPPLTVTGIGLAYDDFATTNVGLSLTELGHFSGGIDIAKGSFILFSTNFIGIILIACLVFLSQGYGRWKKASIGLISIFIASIVLVNPLQNALHKLTIKSEVLGSLVLLPDKFPELFTGQGRVSGIQVNYQDDVLHVDIEGIMESNESSDILYKNISNALSVYQKHLEQKFNLPVVVQASIIPVEILNIRTGGENLENNNPTKEIEKN